MVGDAIVSASIPIEMKNQLLKAKEVTNNRLTVSEIVKKALTAYIKDGGLKEDVETYKGGCVDVTDTKPIRTCKHPPNPRGRYIRPEDPDHLEHLLRMIPEAPKNRIVNPYSEREPFTVKKLSRIISMSETEARVWVMGSRPRRVLGWYQLGWVGYIIGEHGRYYFYRLKDIDGILREADEIIEENRDEYNTIRTPSKPLTLNRAIKDILKRGEWVSTYDVCDELLMMNKKFSKMITAQSVATRLYMLAAERKSIRRSGRYLMHYRNIKGEG